jgi:putative transposase
MDRRDHQTSGCVLDATGGSQRDDGGYGLFKKLPLRVACDFFVIVTATFRTLYVFVIMELETRRILHQNVTAHPTAEWTLQQFREALPGDHLYRFVIHDRDSIFSKGLDQDVTDLGVRVLRTPLRAPMANSVM